jgi:CarD family transcriptional regulator
MAQNKKAPSKTSAAKAGSSKAVQKKPNLKASAKATAKSVKVTTKPTPAKKPASVSKATSPLKATPAPKAGSVPKTTPVAKAAALPKAAALQKAMAKPKAPEPAAPTAAAPKVTKPAVSPANVQKPAAQRPAMPMHKPMTAAAVVAAKAQAMRPLVPPRAMPAAVAKPHAPTLTSPATPKDVARKAAVSHQRRPLPTAAQSAPAASQVTAAAAATAAQPKKPVSQRHGFKTNESIVYPAHGVGRIVGIEEQEIAGISLELFVIEFEKDKMTLRVPTAKLTSVGMRKLADENVVKKAMDTLKGKARIKRTMWSRRAQEYEAKINSGDLVSISEVVRDLYRSESQPEQSYSERQLYEAALDRMAREIAAVEKLDERGAMQRITEVLAKSARGRRLAEEAAAGDAAVKAA